MYIVGAGPGDPGLMTLKSYHLIKDVADVVVYDRLISSEIIGLIPDSVERIYAGKSCRKHVMTQDEINAALVEEAKKGQVVVRLKGGDPFIFGRGGEEVEHLIENDIPFEVVPGVNAADGCSTYCGVPLTHRGLATGVRFVTGHKQKGEDVSLDWKGLACPDTTLVLYMGLTNLDYITKKLIENGLDKDTPVVAIQNGTTVSQRSCFSTLEKIYEDSKSVELKPPTLIVIGKVVALSSASPSK